MRIELINQRDVGAMTMIEEGAGTAHHIIVSRDSGDDKIVLRQGADVIHVPINLVRDLCAEMRQQAR